ncbi:MAG TPA: Fur family transcriptional regulator [Candidatus Saccharimonadales bacterium]|nr:Fur family transcriptional regulator [Candidatus Saccharimonadales bacterium]
MLTDVTTSTREQIRLAGQRVTALRVAILDLLREQDHACADELAVAAKERLGSISLQAVYDSLGVLGSAGLVRRIEPAGSPALFEIRVADNHHHLVCRSCAGVTDVDCAAGHAPCLIPTSDSGYLVDEAEVTYWGICPSCQTGTGRVD